MVKFSIYLNRRVFVMGIHLKRYVFSRYGSYDRPVKMVEETEMSRENNRSYPSDWQLSHIQSF